MVTTNLEQDILVEDKIKRLFNSDLLETDNEKMSNIRVSIIEDRGYDLPLLFNSVYVTPRDVEKCIERMLVSGNIPEKAKMFVNFHSRELTNRNYSSIVKWMIHWKNFDLVGFLDYIKVCHYMKLKINDITKEDIIQCIENICTVHRCYDTEYPFLQLKCFIDLYLAKSIAKHWYFYSRRRISDTLCELIRSVSYENLDDVYSEIYTNETVDMEKSQIPYSVFVSDYNGTWFKPTNNYNEVVDYIQWYNKRSSIHGRNSSSGKPMDMNMLLFMRRYLISNNKKDSSYDDNLKYLQSLFLVSIRRNPQNIKFLIKTANSECNLSEIIKMSLQYGVADLPLYLSACDESIHKDILMRYVECGEDIIDIIPYIHKVANNENIYEFISKITPDRLTIVAEENPLIYDNSEVTLIDVIMSNLHKFTTQMVDTVREAFSNSEYVYKTLSVSERNELYYSSGDLSVICKKYPKIISYMDDISFSDVSIMYKINPDIIRYVNPMLITKSLLISHMRTIGFTELNNIQWIGLEHIMGIHDLVTMINCGKGIGYILDFLNIEYRNAVLQIIE